MESNQKPSDRSGRRGWKRANWNSKLSAAAAAIGGTISQRAGAADHVFFTTVCADSLAG
ncbi:Hypothetical predicted protein [Lynx pardinus]|uniref:Uncharacterized protein n=1 Tax=Lynx pardinus TaxID=191816 RepID=A0A485P6B9_LYNPA|nr:Hypothetical predicted protein [Lynx pardinus]